MRPLRGPQVLIVDDDETSSRTLALLLRLNGFEAEFVLTGADALSSELVGRLDAVILDLHLGEDDIPGFLVLKGIRAKYQRLPIIAMTGWYLSDEYEAEARRMGVTDYLFKPVDESQIVASLQSAVVPVGQACGEPNNVDSIVTAADGPASCRVDRGGETRPSQSSASELANVENAFILSHMPRLVRGLRRSFPAVWYDVILEVVEDTLLEFLANVKRGIWRVRRSVDAHLRQAAWRNVRDHVQAATRRRATEAQYARERSHLSQINPMLPSVNLERFLALAHSEPEAEALRRWIDHQSTLRIAEALGVSHLTEVERSREVKRFKDRIKKRARRNTRRRPPSAQN